jgi:hypothetical protein
MTGGATDAMVDLAMSGALLHQMAASADGTLRVIVGPTRLAAGALPMGDAATTLLNAVNPLHRSESGTQVQCAVAVLRCAQVSRRSIGRLRSRRRSSTSSRAER